MADEKKAAIEEPKHAEAKHPLATPTPTPTPAPGTKPPVLNLRDQVIPGAAWIPLANEITQAERDRLVDALIAYIAKMDFPARFKDVPSALAYFGIMSPAQITRLNKLAEEMSKPIVPLVPNPNPTAVATASTAAAKM